MVVSSQSIGVMTIATAHDKPHHWVAYKVRAGKKLNKRKREEKKRRKEKDRK
jgi:hypothetical protein